MGEQTIMAFPGRIHAADWRKSRRCMAVVSVLSDSQPHSTMEIIERGHVCAVNSIVAELRENGFKIDCRFRERTADGGSVYEYQMTGGGANDI